MLVAGGGGGGGGGGGSGGDGVDGGYAGILLLFFHCFSSTGRSE